MLALENVTKAYGPIMILKGVSLTLGRGETLALVGESGSGKSTLLHLIAGLDHADGGTIRVADRAVEALGDAGRAALRRDCVGIVFQQFNLIQSLTVAENIAFQARLAGRYDAGRAALVSERLGLAELGDRYPEQVSGGQQQRVAIARALAGAPPLLLADEPTGNLDEATGDEVLALMLDLVRDLGMTLVLVTHSRRLAERLGRRVTLAGGVLA